MYIHIYIYIHLHTYIHIYAELAGTVLHIVIPWSFVYAHDLIEVYLYAFVHIYEYIGYIITHTYTNTHAHICTLSCTATTRLPSIKEGNLPMLGVVNRGV